MKLVFNVQALKRPKVGDRVKIMEEGDPEEYEDHIGTQGMLGTVVEVESTPQPYKVSLPNGKQLWYRAAWVEIDEEEKTVKRAENLWPWILRLARNSPQRHKGIHEVAGVLLIGQESTGKTALLKRMLVETIKDHKGEFVPLPMDGLAIVEACGGPRECASHLTHPNFIMNYLDVVFGIRSQLDSFGSRQCMQGEC
jgi:hypothetical protein